MKITLFMVPLLTQGGGAEKYFIDLAKNLSAYQGVKADVITLDENFFRIFARALHLYRLRFFLKIDTAGREKEEEIKRKLGKASWKKSPLSQLMEILNQYEIIYAKNEISELFLLKLIGYQNLPPIVVGIHTPLFYPMGESFEVKIHNFLYQSFFYHWLLRGVRLVHVSNRFTKDYVEKNFQIKSRLIYYPFESNNLKKKTSNLVFNKKKINIAFVGRLSEQKGADILIRLIKKIAVRKKITEKINLNIFGSGDEKFEEEIKNLSREYLWVEYFGHIENFQMLSILVQQNLLLSTSRWEVLPFNILEAQAAGLPVLAFNIPGPADIIKNGQTGFLVKDETEMEEKLVEFINGRFSFNKFLIEKNIKKNFSPTVIYPKLYSMLTEALNENKKT